ncbi:MAG: hypothetical protein WCD40_06580, partial [Candidatus Acidiferrales bacterium]
MTIDVESQIEPDLWSYWCEQGRTIARNSRSFNFEVGDWLNAGAAHAFDGKKMYKTAAELTGFSRPFLYDLASVAAAVPISLRNENLRWSHHRAVSKLPPEQQSGWLEEAEQGDLSVAELRKKMKVRKYSNPSVPADKIEVIAAPAVVTPLPVKKRVFVTLHAEEVKRLEILLKAKVKSVDSYVTDLVRQDLSTCETTAAIENYALTRKMQAESNREAGWEQYVRRTRSSIEALFEELDEGDGGVEASDFVKTWERRHGKKFPYKLAVTFKAWTSRYAGLTEEDCACGDEFSAF